MLAAAGKAARVNGDAWSDLLPAIARHLLGDPPSIEAGGSWRYRKRGSLAVHVDGPQRGTFRDFEAGKSGGVLDLVLHLVEHVNDRTAAAAWLRAEGLLAPHDPQTPVERRTPVHPSGPDPDRERQRDDADGQRLTAWPSSSSTREAKRLTHGRLRGAYLQLPALEATALMLVEGPVDALAARWLHQTRRAPSYSMQTPRSRQARGAHEGECGTRPNLSTPTTEILKMRANQHFVLSLSAPGSPRVS